MMQFYIPGAAGQDQAFGDDWRTLTLHMCTNTLFWFGETVMYQVNLSNFKGLIFLRSFNIVYH